MKIGWLGPESGLRFELLKAQEPSVEIELLKIDNLSQKTSSQIQAILFHPDVYETQVSKLKFTPQIIHNLGFFDGLYIQHGAMTAWNSYLNVFQTLLSKKIEFMDSGIRCLLVGPVVETRAAVSELWRMGFRNFQVLRRPEEPLSWLENQKHHFFGIQIEVVDPKDLVHLSGGASVLIYGIRDGAQISYEHELSYLNFLSRPGLVIDFNDKGFLSRVLKDTQEEQLAYIEAKDIETLSLQLWMAKI